MIHWGFLILAFIAGAASCYGFLYYLTKVCGQVMGAIEEAAKEARF